MYGTIKIVDRLRKTSFENCKNVYLVEVENGRPDDDICQYLHDYSLNSVRFYSAGQHVFCQVVRKCAGQLILD